MDFIPKEIEDYALKNSEAEPDVLYRLNRETHMKMTMPQMLSGHMQGLLLQMFSKMIRPTTILEIGTFTGYSAICLAQGLQKGGKLHTIDINEEFSEIILRHVKEAGLEGKIRLHIGHAVNILPTLKEPFDLVFIDADKENYSTYYDLVFPQVKQGGYIIADNVLWSGKVLSSAMKMDIETKSLFEYSRKIQSDSRVENVLLPLRDGLMIARKK
ncbi:MAG: O-methyltransferase [Bacteroidetes bacterium]|nr:MAG: O-methyltransferase [Bacteroidota bacterium]